MGGWRFKRLSLLDNLASCSYYPLMSATCMFAGYIGGRRINMPGLSLIGGNFVKPITGRLRFGVHMSSRLKDVDGDSV